MSYQVKQFKDGQVSGKITKAGDLKVCLRGNSYEDLFAAASLKEAWDNADPQNKNRVAILELYCLIGQRSDRRFVTCESFDLKVIAQFINSMRFDIVRVLHPHSPVSLALINRSEAIDHFPYVKQAYDELGAAILVSPDAGAYKDTHRIAERLGADLVPSNKVRVNGAPAITVQGNVAGKMCLIVDDLADGGRTFSQLATALKAQGATSVHLYVTHGQFNHGFDELRASITHIYCTNSYRNIQHDMVTQFNVIEA